MSNVPRAILYCVSAAAFALAISSTAFAQGTAMSKMSSGQIAGQYARNILAADDKVQAWDVVIRPGETGPMQSRAGILIYVVTGGMLEHTFTDGSKDVVTRKTGQTFLITEKRPYSVKNIGKTTIHLISIAVQ